MTSHKTPSHTVGINGYALRVIRVMSGVSVRGLAEEIGKDRTYIAKIENGHPRVSAEVYKAILDALKIEDRRVLLANPHPESGEVAA
jgi:transcriptional regulator with XRE-family HTH domain